MVGKIPVELYDEKNYIFAAHVYKLNFICMIAIKNQENVSMIAAHKEVRLPQIGGPGAHAKYPCDKRPPTCVQRYQVSCYVMCQRKTQKRATAGPAVQKLRLGSRLRPKIEKNTNKGFETSINHSTDTSFEPTRFKLIPCNALTSTYTATSRRLRLVPKR